MVFVGGVVCLKCGEMLSLGHVLGGAWVSGVTRKQPLRSASFHGHGTCAVVRCLLSSACAEMLLWVQMHHRPGQHMMKDGSWMKDEDMVRAACSMRWLMCL